MSNLGWYQLMTKSAKFVGGPKVFLLLVAAGGHVGIKALKAGGKLVYKKINIEKQNAPTIETVFEVTNYGIYDSELVFEVGEKYRVLFIDENSILIEKIGDDNNPYLVSLEFLESISSFKSVQK